MKSTFDWIKHINQYKTPIEDFTPKDWDLFSPYVIHKVLSMNEDYLELVNEVQKILPQNKKEIYSIYKEFIPKNNKWSSYIKSKVKQPNNDLIHHLQEYFKCSSREAKIYVDLLGVDKISCILRDIGIEKKEMKKLLK